MSRSYWDVPHSQQPLRVRVRVRPIPKSIEPDVDVLGQLVIGNPYRASHVWEEPDFAASLDAANECDHGRLAGDSTPPCGCWPNELAPELVEDWLVADAVLLLEQGYTLRRIAAAILPLTGCTDVPSCVEILSGRLASLPPVHLSFQPR